jgi:acetyl esterase
MRKLWIISILFGLLCSPAFAEHKIKHYKDIVFASPKGFDLTLDIAVPETKTKNKPVLVIFHGGGFLLNNKSIMTDFADAIASRTDIITVNANYRLLSDLDNTTTINESIEDAMGAVLWVKDNIRKYSGDPNKVAITGDSAGGHLTGMILHAGRNLDSDGFEKKPLGFKPVYLPKGMTAEEVAAKDGLKVQAALLSYTGFNLIERAKNKYETDSNPAWGWAKAKPRGLFGEKINYVEHPEYYLTASFDQYPVKASDYKLPPQFIHVGELDKIATVARNQLYIDQLKALGQTDIEFLVYPGKGHGFLDSGCNDYNKGCFKELSEPTVTDMIKFLNKVFNLK